MKCITRNETKNHFIDWFCNILLNIFYYYYTYCVPSQFKVFSCMFCMAIVFVISCFLFYRTKNIYFYYAIFSCCICFSFSLHLKKTKYYCFKLFMYICMYIYSYVYIIFLLVFVEIFFNFVSLTISIYYLFLHI